MTGWRLAFVAGNKKLIQAYATVKDNTDSGQFRATQKAGIYALENADITNRICEKYSRRFDLLVNVLNNIGFSVSKPKATFYCYAKCPVGTASGEKFQTATDFSEYLLKHALISTVPWDDAGQFIRFSVTFEASDNKQEEAIIHEIQERMMRLDLIFE